MLFERICRTRGIQQRLTKIRSPTTTGKIERFHQSLQREFLDHCGSFADLAAAQAALDGWVEAYNQQRPHQSLNMATPASRFHTTIPSNGATGPAPPASGQPAPVPPEPRGRSDPDTPPAAPSHHHMEAAEVDLVVPPSGTLSLGYQQVWVGRAFAGRTVQISPARRRFQRKP